MTKKKNLKTNDQSQHFDCPYCHQKVAPGDKEIIWVVEKNGERTKAHLAHALTNFINRIGCSPPTGITEPWQIKNFLIDQAECLLDQRCTKKGEKKFQTILQIHEELYGQPLKISSIVASA